MNLYNTTNGTRTFSGVINPGNEDNNLTTFDHWNVDEMQTKDAPEGINLLLFRTMENALQVYKTSNTVKRIK